MADLTREDIADLVADLVEDSIEDARRDDMAEVSAAVADVVDRIASALDAAEARALAAEAAAEGWRQQAERDRAIVTAARKYAAADAAYHEATTGWTEHGEAREWRLRNDDRLARLALLVAVAASPNTERTQP